MRCDVRRHIERGELTLNKEVSRTIDQKWRSVLKV